MIMTATELRELDAWIAEHVMDWKPTFAVMKGDLYYRPGAHGYTRSIYEAGHYSKEDGEKELVKGEPMQLVPHERLKYTTNPAAAMQVLEKCIQKESQSPSIEYVDGEYVIPNPFDDGESASNTLSLTIALFAKKLFSQNKP